MLSARTCPDHILGHTRAGRGRVAHQPCATVTGGRLEVRVIEHVVYGQLTARDKTVYLDGRQAVLYRSRMNPALGRNFEAMP